MPLDRAQQAFGVARRRGDLDAEPWPALAFGPAGLRGGRRQYVEPEVIAGTFWVAEAAGRFRSVAVSGHRAVRLGSVNSVVR